MWIEWIGYLASFLIAVSLLMTDMKTLRVVNAIGCLVFAIYGVLTHAYPVIVSNTAIFLIDLYQLYKMKLSS
jgi:hypothetical protein